MAKKAYRLAGNLRKQTGKITDSSKQQARSSASGRYVARPATAGHQRLATRVVVVKDNSEVGPDAAPTPTPGTQRSAPVPAEAARRTAPILDPLAPERTRWLAETVGGGGKLAAMLGVHASQTSRWATGQERPGARVAPQLIDLEHVLARVRLVWDEPAATTWMISANAHLDGSRPVDVLALRGVGPVLDALDAGAWGGAA